MCRFKLGNQKMFSILIVLVLNWLVLIRSTGCLSTVFPFQSITAIWHLFCWDLAGFAVSKTTGTVKLPLLLVILLCETFWRHCLQNSAWDVCMSPPFLRLNAITSYRYISSQGVCISTVWISKVSIWPLPKLKTGVPFRDTPMFLFEWERFWESFSNKSIWSGLQRMWVLSYLNLQKICSRCVIHITQLYLS